MYLLFFSAINFIMKKCCSIFFNDTATTEIYTLSLHDALPICWRPAWHTSCRNLPAMKLLVRKALADRDRKSTRLKSSHMSISYAVFCLKKRRWGGGGGGGGGVGGWGGVGGGGGGGM